MVTLAQKFQKAQEILNLLEINEELSKASIFLHLCNVSIHLEYSKHLEDLIPSKIIILSHEKYDGYVVFRCEGFDIFLNTYKK